MTYLLNIALMGVFTLSGVLGATTSAVETHIYESPKVLAEISSLRLTGYNAVIEQTNEDPMTTASGARSNHETIIARSRDMADILPYGTIVSLSYGGGGDSCGFQKVEHLVGYRVVADTMHKRKTRQVDVLFGTEDVVRLKENRLNPAMVMGICEVDIRVVGYVPIKDIPSTQEELRLLVENSS